MRKRDENKKEAIFQATTELLNEIGFSEISMSKIAKRAGVSVATIYIYFDNKDDMLRKLYLDVKRKLGATIIKNFDDSLPIRQIVEKAIRNSLQFIIENKESYLFLEQFSNSPLLQNLNINEEVPIFLSIFEVLEKGKKDGMLKQVDDQMLMIYCYLPITQLAKDHFKGLIQITEDDINTIIEMSWDAIKA